MPPTELQINEQSYTVEAEEQMPLLWALRDLLGLTGTKFGCGIGLCGTCTVLVNGEPARSCITSLSAVAGKAVTTIEGLSGACTERSECDGSHPLQIAWQAEHVSQCGYCQPGQIMTAAALLAKNPNPSDAEIDAAMSGNLCRCGTYQRIRRAIRRAAGEGG